MLQSSFGCPAGEQFPTHEQNQGQMKKLRLENLSLHSRINDLQNEMLFYKEKCVLINDKLGEYQEPLSITFLKVAG